MPHEIVSEDPSDFDAIAFLCGYQLRLSELTVLRLHMGSN